MLGFAGKRTRLFALAFVLALALVHALVLCTAGYCNAKNLSPFSLFNDETGNYFVKEPVPESRCLILSWTKWFATESLHRVIEQLPPCPYACEFTYNRSRLHEASALLFHVRDVRAEDLPPKRSDQPWVLFTQEPWAYEFSYREDNSGAELLNGFAILVRYRRHLLSLFDFLGTPSFASDFPFPYHSPLISEIPDQFQLSNDTTRHLTRSALTRSFGNDFTAPQHRGGVTGFISNCLYDMSKRMAYIQKLSEAGAMLHIRGACMPTLNDREDESLTGILQTYNFVLALENSNCDDYVTEKLFRNAFLTGAIPIADGPDSYREYTPHDLAVLHIFDFATPRILAQYLELLLSERHLLALHTAHHNDPSLVKETFSAKVFESNGSTRTSPYFLCGIQKAVRTGHWPRAPEQGAVRKYFDAFTNILSNPCGRNGNWEEKLRWVERIGHGSPVFWVPKNESNGLGSDDDWPEHFTRDSLSSRSHAPHAQLYAWHRIFLPKACVRVWRAGPARVDGVKTKEVQTNLGKQKYSISVSRILTRLKKYLDEPRRELFVHFSHREGFEVWEKAWLGDFELESASGMVVTLRNLGTQQRFRTTFEELTGVSASGARSCQRCLCVGKERGRIPARPSMLPGQTWRVLGCVCGDVRRLADGADDAGESSPLLECSVCHFYVHAICCGVISDDEIASRTIYECPFCYAERRPGESACALAELAELAPGSGQCVPFPAFRAPCGPGGSDEAEKLRFDVESQCIAVVQDLGAACQVDPSAFRPDTLVAEHGHEYFDVLQQNAFPAGWNLPARRRRTKLAKYVSYQRSFGVYGTGVAERIDRDTEVEFLANVDVGKWERQLRELEKLPSWMLWRSTSDALRYVRRKIPGMNDPQLYIKVPGVWTGGHEENNRFRSVNINHGPGTNEWFAFAPQHTARVRKRVIADFGVDVYKQEGLYWPDPEYFKSIGVPLLHHVQLPGEVVVVGIGCVHWVRALSKTLSSAWNYGSLDVAQFASAFERFDLNREIGFVSLVPMYQLSLDLLVAHARDEIKMDQDLHRYLLSRVHERLRVEVGAVLASGTESDLYAHHEKELEDQVQLCPVCSYVSSSERTVSNILECYCVKECQERNRRKQERLRKLSRRVVHLDASESPDHFCLRCGVEHGAMQGKHAVRLQSCFDHGAVESALGLTLASFAAQASLGAGKESTVLRVQEFNIS